MAMPAISFIRLLAAHAPASVFTYLLLWEKMDKNGHVDVDKRTIKYDFTVPVKSFEQHIMQISREGLLNVTYDDKDNPVMSLELVQWEDFTEFEPNLGVCA